MNSDAMNTEQPQESFGSGASEAPAVRSAELRSLSTPGPWYVLDGRRVSWASPYREVGDGFSSYCIAFTYGWPGLIDAEANAILIAAAPELAEQLRDALEFIEDCSDVSDGPDGSPRPNRAMQLCEPIRAALAKAGVKP
jgi:hypothetical protein